MQDIKYPSFTFLAKSRGVVSSVTDTSVNINWNFKDGDVLKGPAELGGEGIRFFIDFRLDLNSGVFDEVPWIFIGFHGC